MPKTIRFRGKTYKSQTALAQKYNIGGQEFLRRRHRGWSIEEALGLKARPTTGKTIEFGGKVYESIKDLCAAYNITFGLFTSRYTIAGWSMEEALGIVPRNRSFKPVKFRGVVYSSIKELCAAYKIKPATYCGRRHEGWTKAEALGLKPRFGKSEKQGGAVYMITNTHTKERYIGLTVRPLKERLEAHFSYAVENKRTKLAAAMRDYPRSAFKIKELTRADDQKALAKIEKKLIKKYNTIENGYNMSSGGAVGGTLQRIEFEGKVYASIAALCRAYGVIAVTVHVRLARGMSLAEAIHTPKKTPRAIPRKWKGKTYESLACLCRENNIPYELIYNRIHTGKTLKQALAGF